MDVDSGRKNERRMVLRGLEMRAAELDTGMESDAVVGSADDGGSDRKSVV